MDEQNLLQNLRLRIRSEKELGTLGSPNLRVGSVSIFIKLISLIQVCHLSDNLFWKWHIIKSYPMNQIWFLKQASKLPWNIRLLQSSKVEVSISFGSVKSTVQVLKTPWLTTVSKFINTYIDKRISVNNLSYVLPGKPRLLEVGVSILHIWFQLGPLSRYKEVHA